MKRSLLFNARSTALLLIGGFTVFLVWNLKERMADRTLEYFAGQREVNDSDAASVRWAHGVNSRRKLTEALTGPDHMLEADVIMRGRDPGEPIMAHPPDTDSDITLREWLQEVTASNKGMKLDFKSLEAVSPSVALLDAALSEPDRPVWINADVLPGPGGAATPLQSRDFLSAVRALPPRVVLSLGWTTGWSAAAAENPGYSWEMVRAMEEICRPLKNPVTFPVRAALLPQSLPQLTWLLQQSDRYTLTVWTGQSDAVTLQDLLPYRREFHTGRIYYDLPDSLRTGLGSASREGN